MHASNMEKPFKALSLCGAVTVKDLQQQLAAAQQQAEDSRAAVAKSEADLEDLSGAYNTLEAHAFKLEGQLRAQQTGTHAERTASNSTTFAQRRRSAFALRHMLQRPH